MFLSDKVMEKIEEVDKKSRPTSLCDRITKDKVLYKTPVFFSVFENYFFF